MWGWGCPCRAARLGFPFSGRDVGGCGAGTQRYSNTGVTHSKSFCYDASCVAQCSAGNKHSDCPAKFYFDGDRDPYAISHGVTYPYAQSDSDDISDVAACAHFNYRASYR
jgi:hypothetical protein